MHYHKYIVFKCGDQNLSIYKKPTLPLNIDLPKPEATSQPFSDSTGEHALLATPRVLYKKNK